MVFSWLAACNGVSFIGLSLFARGGGCRILTR